MSKKIYLKDIPYLTDEDIETLEINDWIEGIGSIQTYGTLKFIRNALRVFKTTHHLMAGRSTGRTRDFGSRNAGSNPAPPAKEKYYKIACRWEESATVLVKAKSLKEAIEKVRNEDSLPYPGEYIEDSFEIDEELSEYLSKELQDVSCGFIN